MHPSPWAETTRPCPSVRACMPLFYRARRVGRTAPRPRLRRPPTRRRRAPVALPSGRRGFAARPRWPRSLPELGEAASPERARVDRAQPSRSSVTTDAPPAVSPSAPADPGMRRRRPQRCVPDKVSAASDRRSGMFLRSPREVVGSREVWIRLPPVMQRTLPNGTPWLRPYPDPVVGARNCSAAVAMPRAIAC
jgi:hypothetical protein